MQTATGEGLFSDEVFTATELNRHGGTILDHARKHPVTISRNNEQFAILRREDAARLYLTVDRMGEACALLSEAHLAIAGEKPSPYFAWLSVYEKDDLEKLVSEVFSAVRKATGKVVHWDQVEAVIHEWRESAIVAHSGALDAAMHDDERDETPLQHPEDVLRSGDVNTEPECQKKAE
jgi:hypothetical protein